MPRQLLLGAVTDKQTGRRADKRSAVQRIDGETLGRRFVGQGQRSGLHHAAVQGIAAFQPVQRGASACRRPLDEDRSLCGRLSQQRGREGRGASAGDRVRSAIGFDQHERALGSQRPDGARWRLCRRRWRQQSGCHRDIYDCERRAERGWHRRVLQVEARGAELVEAVGRADSSGGSDGAEAVARYRSTQQRNRAPHVSSISSRALQQGYVPLGTCTHPAGDDRRGAGAHALARAAGGRGTRARSMLDGHNRPRYSCSTGIGAKSKTGGKSVSFVTPKLASCGRKGGIWRAPWRILHTAVAPLRL